MKKYAWAGLLLVISIQLAVPFYMILHREKTLREGELFRFQTRPIDPTDPFQGKYVRLGFEDDYIPCSKEETPDLKYKEPVYVTVETDAEGFAMLADWSREKPAEGSYFRTRYLGLRRRWNQTAEEMIHHGIRFELPFNRFYMEETKAPAAERLARESTRQTNCWANVRILEGNAVLEDVYAQGRSLREIAGKKE